MSANYDDDFDGELLTIKPRQSHDDFDQQEKTLRPTFKKVESAKEPTKSHARQHSRKFSRSTTAPVGPSSGPKSPGKSHFGAKFELPSRPDLAFREQSVEDYSDLQVDNDNVFSNALKRVRRTTRLRSRFGANMPQGLRQSDSPQLFHPSDLTSLPRSMQSPVNGSVSRRQAPSRPSVLPDRPMRRTRSSIEIQKFAEDEDDEDFSDIFGPADQLTEKEESDRGSEDNGLMLLSKLSNNSWLGDEEDDDDPFASMDPGWDEMNLEANIARDRHARLCEKVEELVRSLKTTESDEMLCELSEDLLALLWENSEVKDLIITAHGLLPILEILEPCTVKSRHHMIVQLLKVVNSVSSGLRHATFTIFNAF